MINKWVIGIKMVNDGNGQGNYVHIIEMIRNYYFRNDYFNWYFFGIKTGNYYLIGIINGSPYLELSITLGGDVACDGKHPFGWAQVLQWSNFVTKEMIHMRTELCIEKRNRAIISAYVI
ncbi:hypothetical protein RhiirA4_520781 [Rhizophagus irregularis]|uniref:Uncharacterized protein n=1 Tax=Rhizophagus irregularis TaxID=588596 RepID=A0A2I1GJN5_9GLOM|nr:hypothetical protein RhiirA4_520781 [Rhizophagus irregularis]